MADSAKLFRGAQLVRAGPADDAGNGRPGARCGGAGAGRNCDSGASAVSKSRAHRCVRKAGFEIPGNGRGSKPEKRRRSFDWQGNTTRGDAGAERSNVGVIRADVREETFADDCTTVSHSRCGK